MAGGETSGTNGTEDARRAAAIYIADLSGSLAAVARLHGFDALSYVLEMARLEAQSAADDPPSG